MKALSASIKTLVLILAVMAIYGKGDPFTDPHAKAQMAEMEENQARWEAMSDREKASILARSPHQETAEKARQFLAGHAVSPLLVARRSR